MALPPEWDISAAGFQNPATFQPVKLIKELARYPHASETYFAKHHTVMVGEEPLLQPMKAAMLMPPVLVPELREPLELGNGERICFYAVYLLHEDELNLKLQGDLDRLFERFAEREVTEMYDLGRRSVLAD